MLAVLNFVFFIILSLLFLLRWALILNAILSWLVAFDVINLRNRAMYSIARVLDAVTRPVLRPFQRVIPVLGGVDVSPVIAILVIYGIERFLLPPLHASLASLIVGGGPVV
jgi:YggT family protein